MVLLEPPPNPKKRVKTGTYWSTRLADWAQWSRWAWRTLPTHRKSCKEQTSGEGRKLTAGGRQPHSHALLFLPWHLSVRARQPHPADTNVVAEKLKTSSGNRIYLMEVCCRDMHLISILPRYPGWSSWARQTHRTLQSITSSWANRAFLPLGDRREVRLAPDVSEESR